MGKPIVQENGLVACTVLQAFGQWFPKMVAGFSPTDAIASKAKGLVDYEEEAGDEPAASEPEGITIPGDWKDLPWMSLRSLAMKIAGDSVDASLNKDQALSIIEAHVAAQEGN
jgi:hypothetical protein